LFLIQTVLNKYLTAFQKSGKSYFKYPEYVDAGTIQKEILYDLKKVFDIEISDEDIFSDFWDRIKDSKRFKDTQVQIAGELIAQRISDEICE
jgi:hypothetical protein